MTLRSQIQSLIVLVGITWLFYWGACYIASQTIDPGLNVFAQIVRAVSGVQ